MLSLILGGAAIYRCDNAIPVFMEGHGFSRAETITHIRVLSAIVISSWPVLRLRIH
jgi:hypothetical protein